MATQAPQKSTRKVHVKIPPHPRALCGLVPKNGDYRIVSMQNFFTAAEEDQCATCLRKLAEKGYKVELLRIQYRTIYDHAQELALAA